MNKYTVQTTYKRMFDTDVVVNGGQKLTFPAGFGHLVSAGDTVCEYVTDMGAPFAYYCNGQMYFNDLHIDTKAAAEYLDAHVTKNTERMCLNAALIRALRYNNHDTSLSVVRNIRMWLIKNKGNTR